MHYLAKNQSDKPIALSVVSEELGLPENYLEQLMRKLKAEKLVTSTRGAYGGYTLAKDAKDTYVGEILRALENSMALTECAADEKACDNSDLCACRAVWKKIQDGINSVIDSYTLEDMVKDEESLQARGK